MPRIATIDVGTNTALLLVAEMRDGLIKVVHEAERFVRLGEGVDASGRICEAAVGRLVEALAAFREEAVARGAERFVVAATSAARDAANRGDVVAAVRERTGLEVHVINGKEEAAISFRGAVSAFELAGRSAVLDIGGGSTELIVGDVTHGGEPHYVRSIDLGAVRLTERCFSSQPPRRQEAEEAAALVRAALEEADVPQDVGLPLVGAAGTPTALAMVHYGLSLAEVREAPPSLSADAVRQWRDHLFTLGYREVLELHDEAMPGRADVFPAGVLLLDAFVRRLGVREVLVSPRGLRHGLALDALG